MIKKQILHDKFQKYKDSHKHIKENVLLFNIIKKIGIVKNLEYKLSKKLDKEKTENQISLDNEELKEVMDKTFKINDKENYSNILKTHNLTIVDEKMLNKKRKKERNIEYYNKSKPFKKQHSGTKCQYIKETKQDDQDQKEYDSSFKQHRNNNLKEGNDKLICTSEEENSKNHHLTLYRWR